MLFAPLGISSFGFLTDLVIWGLKTHTQVNLRVLFLDVLDFASVFCIPIAFTFQKHTVR